MGKRGEGHLYLRGLTWWAKYFIDGAARYESMKTTDEATARQNLQTILVDARRGLVRGARTDRVRVDELLDDLIAEHELSCPKSVEVFTRPNVKKHLRPFFGKLRVHQVT